MMVDKQDHEAIVTAYRGGLRVDMLQAKSEEGWGVIWTVPPALPEAMEKAARQMRRARVHTIRHMRRARAKNTKGDKQDIVIVTILPSKEQCVYCLDTSKPLSIPYLRDETLAALEAVFAAIEER